MLVLNRSLNEEIVITINGIEAVISIAEIRDKSVKIGVQAPKSVTVDRREIWAKKQVNNISAESSSK